MLPSRQYPEKSGNWYDGKHQPLITRELFDKVQEQLKRDQIVRSEIKEFAFTKLMMCGLCGSGVSAEEKYKKLKDGTSARYVYYGCSRARDKNCKAGYMREEDLIEQLVKVIDKLDISEIGMQHKFEEEVARFNKFQKGILGMQGLTTKVKDVDLRTYAKYLLAKEASLRSANCYHA